VVGCRYRNYDVVVLHMGGVSEFLYWQFQRSLMRPVA
jgi:hypothetical protein